MGSSVTQSYSKLKIGPKTGFVAEPIEGGPGAKNVNHPKMSGAQNYGHLR